MYNGFCNKYLNTTITGWFFFFFHMVDDLPQNHGYHMKQKQNLTQKLTTLGFLPGVTLLMTMIFTQD